VLHAPIICASWRDDTERSVSRYSGSNTIFKGGTP
jgi:hypothetical protein